MNEAGKTIATAAAAGGAGVMGGAALVSAPLFTLGTMGAGLAGDYVVNKATRYLSDDKYQNWGEFAGDKTGINPELMAFTNPGGIVGGVVGLHARSLGRHALQKARPYLLGNKKIPMMGYKPKSNFIDGGIENGIDPKTFGVNRIFEGNPLIVSSNENAFKTTVGKFYRLTGQPQIDDIAANGGYVLAKRGKIKGGRFGETHWSKANGHTYNPNEGGYLIEADNIINNQIGGIPSNSVNIYKVNNGKWELYKSKEFKSEIDWGKWNKEIPENKALMREYNAIEQQAKSNGTWMKNPDGSDFVGSKLTKKEIIKHPKLANNITNDEIAKMQWIERKGNNFKTSK